MNNEVLETVEFPEIVFESTAVNPEKLRDDLYRVHVRGQLRLHGISNEQVLVSQAAFGADSIRAYGAFALRQTDYNIRIASIAGGTLKLQDELKFSFYVVARKPN
jgi:polyisoprenoid-binding protein YceI